jgi:RHS repeat-associated protein
MSATPSPSHGRPATRGIDGAASALAIAFAVAGCTLHSQARPSRKIAPAARLFGAQGNVMRCTVLERLVACVLALFVTLSAVNADPTTAPEESAAGVFGEGSPAYGEPDKSGALTYSYPFQLLPARGGPQPRLTLTYNSSSRDREAGYGWGLDLPVIERKPLTGFPRFFENGEPLDQESYAYNGQSLVFICQIGIPGQNCKDSQGLDEPQPEWSAGGPWRYYRLEVEGMFARFYLSHDRKYWRVQLKGGELLEFGEPPDGGTPGMEHGFDGENAIVRWRLVRHSDAVHKIAGRAVNSISYRWKHLGKRGLLYLSDIFDTPPPDHPDDISGSAHHVQLTWEAPDFPQTSYVDVDKAVPDQRLVRVAISSVPWSGEQPREVIRLYRLRYAKTRTATSFTFPPSSSDAPLWHHSFLREIQLEGRCGWFENSGEIPPGAQCPPLPPVTFEYEPGLLGSILYAAADVSNVHDAPPGAVADRHVLPFVHSVGIVDFNRDGLPDLVQSWETCRDPYVGAKSGSVKVGPGDDPDLFCSHPGEFGLEWDKVRSARPLVGYLNGGRGGTQIDIYRQCMDAGLFSDPSGLSHYNRDQPPGFLTGLSAATIVGSWGQGVVAWSRAQFAPYLARPVLPDSGAGSDCDLFDFHEEKFAPGWRWEQTQAANDWARKNDDLNADNKGSLWYVDVDGDGLIDLLGAISHDHSGDFQHGAIAFTRQYAKGEKLPGGTSGEGPVLVPFLFDITCPAGSPCSPGAMGPTATAPSPKARKDTRFFYVDVNGDGIVDLVSYNPGDDGGIPRVRPGNGRGDFACYPEKQPWPCLPPGGDLTAGYAIEVPDPKKPWPFTEETLFHDVNGDGLADIVKYDMSTGFVSVWFNQDGHTFACATPSCTAGLIWDVLHGTPDVGEHHVAFADMDGDGIDDLVVIAGSGVFVASLVHGSDPFTYFEARASRPGLLTKIHNGTGATIKVSYQTVQELDITARKDGHPWHYHSPVVENVVTHIITQDDGSASGTPLPLPYRFDRRVQYEYRDPAYDAWSRKFAGFRKMRAQTGNEAAVTETTYWFGPCQNNALQPRLAGGVVIVPCPDGSDYDQFKSATGQIVRIDRYVPGFDATWVIRRSGDGKYLWTKMFAYAGFAPLFERSYRWVNFNYPSTIDTYVYDDAQPSNATGEDTPVLRGDPLERPRTQVARKHIRRSVTYDILGNLQSVHEMGAEPSDTPETETITVLTQHDPSGPSILPTAPLACTADWQCLPIYISVWEPGGTFDTPLKKLRYTYTVSGLLGTRAPAGDLRSIDGWLESAEPLQRHPATGAAAGPPPPGQAIARGWHTLARFGYDDWGNVEQQTGGGAADGISTPCIAFEYERPFRQLPDLVHAFKNGCGSEALDTAIVYDRGFGRVASSVAPNGAKSERHFDPFGRTVQILSPVSDTLTALLTTETVTIAHGDGAPVRHVDTSRVVDPGVTIRSVNILNGLGESVMTFDQGDSVDGWIVRGWTERNSAGQIETVRRPWSFVGKPLDAARTAASIPAPTAADGASLWANYDEFGRLLQAGEDWFSSAVTRLERKYFPLAIEARDAEQLKSASLHHQAFTRVEYDGHNRTKRKIAHLGFPSPDEIATTITYYATGEPKVIERSHDGGESYRRTMSFDTLGRLMRHAEPNTGKNWRYVWDDAGQIVGTSDSRGCGANFYHDGLGRRTAEEYWPCTGAQPSYTPPNFETGEGLAAVYRYDTYEPGQVNPDVSFLDDPAFAKGRLTAIRDRGSHTRFNYDARGRVRRVSRQIAKPTATDAGTAYAEHWFASRLDYDLADRLARRTTGVDVPELLPSAESYFYSPRGLLSGIDSSYGMLIKSVKYDPDGAIRGLAYGDYAATTATYDYEPDWRRLTRYHIARSAPSAWTGPPSPTYALPDASTTQLDLLDYHFSYDDAGNPLLIEDWASSAWPPHAAPVKRRRMDYDDLYRLIGIGYTYATPSGTAPVLFSPFEPEIAADDRRPMPLRDLPSRIQRQDLSYDFMGNLTASSDDLAAQYDRSLGSPLSYGTADNGPNQLQSGSGFQVRYDNAGNLVQLKIERPGICRSGFVNRCAQWFAYDWDEVGQLAHARRWDFETLPKLASPDELPSMPANWDLGYAYSQGNRIRVSATDASGEKDHTLDIFPTLRVDRAQFDSDAGDYQSQAENVHAYVGGVGHVFWDAEGRLPRLSGAASRAIINLVMPDQLGSSSVVINHGTGELVERTTFQAYGAVETDNRSPRWKAFRELYKFTAKEQDVETGTQYFGARYYNPYLGRWMSPDPLAIHVGFGDLNPYAYVSGRVMTRVDPAGLQTSAPSDDCTPPQCIHYEFPTDYITGSRPKPEPQPEPQPQPPVSTEPAPSTPSETARTEVEAATAGSRGDLASSRGEAAAEAAQNRPSFGERFKAGFIQGSKEGALNLVDPFHVNRNFVKDIARAVDPNATNMSRSVAGASMVLAIVPAVGELRLGAALRPFAMGLEGGLDAFAEARGATTWKNFADPVNWQPGVIEKLADPNTMVHFNLEGVDVWEGISRAATGVPGKFGATDWELLQIRQNPQWWDTLQFWEGGKPVPNPFAK